MSGISLISPFIINGRNSVQLLLVLALQRLVQGQKLNKESGWTYLICIHSSSVCPGCSVIHLKLINRVHCTKLPNQIQTFIIYMMKIHQVSATLIEVLQRNSFWQSLFDHNSSVMAGVIEPCPLVTLFLHSKNSLVSGGGT